MPRQPRVIEGSGPHHLTARGSNRMDIFRDPADYQSFITALAGVARMRQWSCLAYCLMPNHVHLVVGGEPEMISRGMQSLLGGHAQRFNHRHERSGHLFGQRFHHVTITNDRQLIATLRYVALNPVRAGISANPTSWHWSSYSALANGVLHPGAIDRPALDRLIDPFVLRTVIEQSSADHGDSPSPRGQSPGGGTVPGV